jgi:hypothetical protein
MRDEKPIGELTASFCRQVAYGSQICFATFIQWKITKLLKTQQPLKLDKK